MNVAADARVWALDRKEAVAATLADVPAGAKVKLRGVIDRRGATPVFTVKVVKFHVPAVEVAPPPAE
jgi:hypothetical protein